MNQLRFLFVILLIFILVGCSHAIQNVSESPNDSSILTQKTLEFTKNDAIAIFKDNDFNNYEITDLILVQDEQLPMLKAVISFYDRKENNSSNLAFIYGDVSWKICFAVNDVEGVKTFDIAEDRQLTYVGDGTVTTSIRKIETNEIIDYKITFSRDISTPTTHFEVNSEERREEVNQVSSIVVKERQNEEYISIKEVVLLDEIKTVTDLLENTKWEENIKVEMEHPPDYRFTLNSISYAIWITPKGNRLEIVVDSQAKYTKLPIEDSKILYKLMTGKVLQN